MFRNYLKKSLIILSAIALAGCSNTVATSQNELTITDVKSDTKQILKFKTGDVKALALTEDNQNNIIKIRENGTTDSYIEVPSNLTLSSIHEIAKSDTESSGTIYILFDKTVSVPPSVEYSYKDEKNNTLTAGVPENYKIGQLLCVFENGTYDDVLYDSKNSSWKSIDIKTQDKNNLVFDKAGHLYFLVLNSDNNSNMIYMYCPFEKSVRKITPAISGTFYKDICVSDDGKWLFATTDTSQDFGTNTVLRAIKLSNPENYSTLFEIKDGLSWTYNDSTNCIYCIYDGVLYQYQNKNGSFSSSAKKEIINANLKIFDYKDVLFSQKDSESKYYLLDANSIDFFYIFYSKTDEINTRNVVTYLFDKAWSSLKKKDLLKVKRTYINAENKKYNAEYYSDLSERYDIRFDSFKNIKGFEELANKTKGLKNEDAINALIKNSLLTTFAELLESGRYSKKTDSFAISYYENNFFADVLYQKGTDNKIDFDEFSITKNKFFSTPGLVQSNLFYKKKSDKETKTWKRELTKNENGKITVEPEKVLKTLASYCSAPEIDFSLRAFKDISEYSALYTESKNEDAILYLDSVEKIELFCNFMDKTSDLLNKNSNILSLTCFKKGTTEPAYYYNKLASKINWKNVSNLKSYSQKTFMLLKKMKIRLPICLKIHKD